MALSAPQSLFLITLYGSVTPAIPAIPVVTLLPPRTSASGCWESGATAEAPDDPILNRIREIG